MSSKGSRSTNGISTGGWTNNSAAGKTIWPHDGSNTSSQGTHSLGPPRNSGAVNMTYAQPSYKGTATSAGSSLAYRGPPHSDMGNMLKDNSSSTTSTGNLASSNYSRSTPRSYSMTNIKPSESSESSRSYDPSRKSRDGTLAGKRRTSSQNTRSQSSYPSTYETDSGSIVDPILEFINPYT